jgi:hypothetical protein
LTPTSSRPVHTRRAVRGEVNISEDARHWIGFLQYNPSTILGIENSSVPVPYNGERVCSEDYLYIPRGLNPADLSGRYGQERYCGQIFGNLLAGPVLSYSKPFTIRQGTWCQKIIVIIMVMLHNGGFCNGCITKRILLLQAFHSQENQYYADYDKKYYIFIYLFFYHREIVKLDHFVTLSLSYANTVL